MKKKLDMWEWMREKQNEIGDHLRKSKFSQGTVTIENREDKFVMTVIMPKDGKLKIHSDDIPLCKHILG
jgi:uncharacterized membrane protein